MKLLLKLQYLILLTISSFVILVIASNTTCATSNIDATYPNQQNTYYAQASDTENTGPKISFQYTGNDWVESDFDIVWKSLYHISEMIGTEDVVSCIESRTLRYEGIDSVRAMIDYYALASAEEWPALIITGEFKNVSWAGMAAAKRVLYGERSISFASGDTVDTYFLRFTQKPEITVNLKYVRDDQSMYGEDLATKNLSGVILHELLHQMGHLHPTTGDQIQDYYQGQFITVAGDCLSTDGRSARGSSRDSDKYADSRGYIPPGGWVRID